LNTATAPPPLSADTASPEAAAPTGHDTLGTPGWLVLVWLAPAAYTVTLPAAAPPATLTDSATAAAPVAGTPPCPATGTVTLWPAPTWTVATGPPGSGSKPPPTDPNGSESSEVSAVVLLAIVPLADGSAVSGWQAATEAAMTVAPATAARTVRAVPRPRQRNPILNPTL